MVLKPFKDITFILSCSEATFSQYIPMIRILVDSLQTGAGDGVRLDSGTIVVTLKRNLLHNLLSCLGNIEKEELYQLSSLLDPRYKQWCFRETENKDAAISKFKMKLNLVAEDEENNSAEHSQAIQSESDTDTTSNSSRGNQCGEGCARLLDGRFVLSFQICFIILLLLYYSPINMAKVGMFFLFLYDNL